MKYYIICSNNVKIVTSKMLNKCITATKLFKNYRFYISQRNRFSQGDIQLSFELTIKSDMKVTFFSYYVTVLQAE